MNSDNVLDLIKKITYPFDTNKYISGIFMIILLVNTQYFIPQPILPNIIVDELKKYGLLSFIFTLLFSYLLTKDINVSIVVSLLLFGLNYLNLKFRQDAINIDNNDLLINKVTQKDNIKFSNKKPEENKIIANTDLSSIDNSSKKISHYIDDFEFSDENLKYLQNLVKIK
jgi:hypothetical protein